VRDAGRRRSPDSTVRARRPISRPTDDGGRRTPHGPPLSRPWDDTARPRRHSTDAEDDDDCDDVIDDDDVDDDNEEIEVADVETSRLTTRSTTTSTHDAAVSQSSVCPLDALLRMTSQPFDDPLSPGETILILYYRYTLRHFCNEDRLINIKFVLSLG